MTLPRYQSRLRWAAQLIKNEWTEWDAMPEGVRHGLEVVLGVVSEMSEKTKEADAVEYVRVPRDVTKLARDHLWRHVADIVSDGYVFLPEPTASTMPSLLIEKRSRHLRELREAQELGAKLNDALTPQEKDSPEAGQASQPGEGFTEAEQPEQPGEE